MVAERTIDPAAQVLVVHHPTDCELTLDNRHIYGRVAAVVATAAVRARGQRASLELKFIQIGVMGQHTHQPILGTDAIKRALRAAYDFDPVQIINIWIGRDRRFDESKGY